MNPVEIKKGIYWAGAIDWDLRNFHGYLTQRGSTYNAYLIVDEKITLVDTVKHYLFDEMLARIRQVVDPEKIDYIVCNHVEMDHSGSLPLLKEIARKAVVLASPQGEKGLKRHFKRDLNCKAVQSGETISIGKLSLRFFHTPMVHWPDSMVTYIPEESLLLPNDAFGQHIAACERFDDEIGWEIAREEAAKYYANIVLLYGEPVKKALGALGGLKIGMIAPSHGIIWRKYLPEIIQCYKNWADNACEEKAVIVYDTMWGSTEKMAQAVRAAFEAKEIKCEMRNLKTNHISDIMTSLLTSKYICVGSPTLNNGLLPTAAAFLAYVKGLAPKNRTGIAFGSYGWGGQSVALLEKFMEEASMRLPLRGLKLQYVPDEAELTALTEKVAGIL